MLKKFLLIILLSNYMLANLAHPEHEAEHRAIRHDKPIVLHSPMLQAIDGMAGGIDANAINKIIYICQRIVEFQIGIAATDGKQRKPQHMYKGKLYTLKELVKFTENDKSKELVSLLDKLKEEFSEITMPFLNDAKGSKQQIISLIKVFAEMRHKPHSLLLNWSKAQDENESFRESVTSVKFLDEFCDDLLMFLKDMMRSCPKAVAAWKEKYKK